MALSGAGTMRFMDSRANALDSPEENSHSRSLWSGMDHGGAGAIHVPYVMWPDGRSDELWQLTKQGMVAGCRIMFVEVPTGFGSVASSGQTMPLASAISTRLSARSRSAGVPRTTMRSSSAVTDQMSRPAPMRWNQTRNPGEPVKYCV